MNTTVHKRSKSCHRTRKNHGDRTAEFDSQLLSQLEISNDNNKRNAISLHNTRVETLLQTIHHELIRFR